MKRYIISLVCALAAVSCGMKEIEPVLSGSDAGFVEGLVTTEVCVAIPDATPATKAFSDEPAGQINNLYVAVFDDSHYLTQYIKAECLDGYPTQSSDGSTALKRYKVTFNVTKNKPRIVHLIANGPDTVGFGTEEEVIASMVAYKSPDPSKGQIGPDVYWNRLLLPEGLSYDPSIVDSYGNKTLVASSADILRKVGLIRNFAKFNIQSLTGDFVLTEAKILMSPDVSYVAAYNKTKGEFVMDYAALRVTELLESGYIGSAPAMSKPLTDFDNPVPASSEGIVSEFMFEREKPTSAPACVIVGGKYRGSSATTYYRINLVDEKGEYYPIMRNFNYFVKVTAVAAEGKPTIQEAYESAGSGDISTSFEFESLPEVSNGISAIEVEYTDKVAVSANPFTLQYRYTPDVTSSATNNKFIWCDSEPTSFPEDGVYVYLGKAGDFGAAIQGVELLNDAAHSTEGVLRVTPVAPGAVSKLQTINFVGVCTKGEAKVTIHRVVTITVRQKFSYSISCVPSAVPEIKGAPVSVNITLPSGLRESIFPLQVMLEAENNTLAPKAGENLPVETGVSLWDPSRPGYHFVKTITWAEYYHGDGLVNNPSDYTTVFPCKFVTNTAYSATGIKAVNPYFNDAQTYLDIDGNYVFADDFEWLAPFAESVGAGQTVEAGDPNESAPNIYTTASLSSLVSELKSRGYGFINSTSLTGKGVDPGKWVNITTKNFNVVYLQSCYLKFGKTSYNAGIVLPKLSSLSSPSAVLIEFDWCWQITGGARPDLMTLQVEAAGGGLFANGKNVSDEITSDQITVDGEANLAWQRVSIVLNGANENTVLTIRPTNADPTISNPSRDQNRWFLDNIRISRTGSVPMTAKVSWAFTEATMDSYKDLFGGTAGVVSKAEGFGVLGDGSRMRVPSTSGEGGNIYYYQVDKSGTSPTSGNPKRIIGGTGDPYITGGWPGDYWLIEYNDGTVFKAGTEVNVNFLTRVSATGHKYMMAEYWDGQAWQPAFEVKTETETGTSAKYNFVEGTADAEVNASWTLAKATNELKFRFTIVANWQQKGEALPNPNGGTCRISDRCAITVVSD